MSTPRRSSRTVATVAAVSVLGLLGLTACGGSGGSEGSASADGAANRSLGSTAARAPMPSAPASGHSLSLGDTGSGKAPAVQDVALTSGGALIKTGSVALRSAQIGHVLVRVYALVGGVGGQIGNEDTATNPKGEVVRSLLTLRVPVASFDRTLDDLSRLGTLVDRTRSAKDVTTQVADVRSRVRSAHRSIATLRRLFGRASRLGDIIRLESELSQRESNLEALQAEQTALRDKTTFSTITMTIELPPVVVKPSPRTTDHAASGFAGGIRQGWRALTRTTVAVAHAVGLVLPLGIVVLLLAGLALWIVRRFVPTPTARAATEPTPES